jgi:uncharacterized protein (TIGR01244 family)
MGRMNSAMTLLAAIVAAAPAVSGNAPAESIPNYRVIEPGLAAAGQPSAETLRRLKELGFKTVVNLRPAGEAPIVADEPAIVEGQGLRYVSVPVTPSTFSAADVASVRKVLDDPEAAPVLLHCASSNRVGAVLAVIAHQRGRTLDEAEAEGRRAGLSSPSMVEAFRKVATDGAARRD